MQNPHPHHDSEWRPTLSPDKTLPSFDVQAQIAQLFVYPVKSCAGVALQEAVMTCTGLDLDRAWMVVDRHGAFVSQRELPRMALIQPQLRHYDIVLRAPGMLALHLLIDTVEAATTVRVWQDTVKAFDMGDLAAQWFSDFLAPQRASMQDRPYRLVRFDPEQRRLSNLQWTGGVEAPNQFSDGYPVLVTSTASLDGRCASAVLSCSSRRLPTPANPCRDTSSRLPDQACTSSRSCRFAVPSSCRQHPSRQLLRCVRCPAAQHWSPSR